MKKNLSFLLILVFIFSFTACKKENKEEQPKVNAFEIKTAVNVVESYMNFIMKEDYESAKKLFTKELFRKASNMPISEIKVKGYNIIESNEIGRSGVIKVRTTRTSMTHSLSSLDEYTIKVVKDGAEYKVSEVSSMLQKEAFSEGMSLRFRDKKNIKTNLIIDKAGLPKYAYSREDGAQLYKILVPTKEFSSINFDYEGGRLAISTYNKDSFIGIVNIDESLAVQGDAQNSQGQQSQGGGSEVMAKEKPIGKELISVDLLMNCKVDFMSFSLDGKFLLVQYIKEDSGKCIMVYKAESGESIPINFEKDYPIEKVQIVFSSFGEDAMSYEVIPKSSLNNSEADIIGKWKLNLKTFTIQKL
ncbi:hypothetical protein LGK97_17450 [Clostridium sp. CS001]|uniref:hypothetical protein n=1 Tax=Clostridium sp. CS001 TaxID=2880648 RepID=UPI001CF0E5E1|nr:hypothetical protein [Clostridium sp. CS001]MCB2291510.1 hypothetical protein [Clostridium sp. CS001]